LNISFEDTQRITRDALIVPGIVPGHPSIPGTDVRLDSGHPSIDAASDPGHPPIGGADRVAASSMGVTDSSSDLVDVLDSDAHDSGSAGYPVGVQNLGAPAPVIPVELAMTYGSPSIPRALRRLQAAGARRLLVLPLYPQYSGTTTASVFDQVTTELQRWRWLPEVRFVNEYHDEPAYIAAIAASVTAHWQKHGKRHLLFSFHSTPKSYLLAGDPYHCQCLKTARLVTERLRLAAGDWSISFQSRVGREEWLRPYTDDLLREYAGGKQQNLDVLCPGFAADNLETLEEIDIRNRELFLTNGGKSYHYIPALNATDNHVDLLAGLVRRHTQGWIDNANAADDPEARTRALRAGAAR
jgi:protoporphyrin/coproporphyrin ferrochelatase